MPEGSLSNIRYRKNCLFHAVDRAVPLVERRLAGGLLTERHSRRSSPPRPRTSRHRPAFDPHPAPPGPDRGWRRHLIRFEVGVAAWYVAALKSRTIPRSWLQFIRWDRRRGAGTLVGSRRWAAPAVSTDVGFREATRQCSAPTRSPLPLLLPRAAPRRDAPIRRRSGRVAPGGDQQTDGQSTELSYQGHDFSRAKSIGI